MTTEDYVSYPIALALKKAGFDEPCRDFYWTSDGTFKHTDAPVHKNSEHCTTMVAAPTLWLAQKWLRERAIEVDVNPMFSHGGRDGYDWDVYNDFTGYPIIRGTLPFAETYESALSAGIAAALELIEKEGG